MTRLSLSGFPPLIIFRHAGSGNRKSLGTTSNDTARGSGLFDASAAKVAFSQWDLGAQDGGHFLAPGGTLPRFVDPLGLPPSGAGGRGPWLRRHRRLFAPSPPALLATG
jgi:hypothetical protein